MSLSRCDAQATGSPGTGGCEAPNARCCRLLPSTVEQAVSYGLPCHACRARRHAARAGELRGMESSGRGTSIRSAGSWDDTRLASMEPSYLHGWQAAQQKLDRQQVALDQRDKRNLHDHHSLQQQRAQLRTGVLQHNFMAQLDLTEPSLADPLHAVAASAPPLDQ